MHNAAEESLERRKHVTENIAKSYRSSSWWKVAKRRTLWLSSNLFALCGALDGWLSEAREPELAYYCFRLNNCYCDTVQLYVSHNFFLFLFLFLFLLILIVMFQQSVCI
jgi:hypothetical protein